MFLGIRPCTPVYTRTHEAYAQMHFEKLQTLFYNQDSKMDKCQNLLTYEHVIRCSLKSPMYNELAEQFFSISSNIRRVHCRRVGACKSALWWQDAAPGVPGSLTWTLHLSLGASVPAARVSVKQMSLTSPSWRCVSAFVVLVDHSYPLPCHTLRTDLLSSCNLLPNAGCSLGNQFPPEANLLAVKEPFTSHSQHIWAF